MNLLIIGASRGLGAAFALKLPKTGDTLWTVSRTRPEFSTLEGVQHTWIEADLARAGAGKTLQTALEGQTLDAVIYNAGIWEENAFSSSYDFETVTDLETERIIAVNLTSAITCIRAVLPCLKRSSAAKIILVGSTSGLENNGRLEVAYSASKFGLRGVAHALREGLRSSRIGVTCLNLGDLGTVTWEGGEVRARGFDERKLIDPNDVLELVRCLLTLSNSSCVKEIDFCAMTDSV